MIGLRRHTVRVVDDHPAWLAMGESECQSLRELGKELVVDAQHIGSTAVPGLPAKPILDIAILIETVDVVPAMVERLTPAGYIYRGDSGDSGGHLFVRESERDVRVAHVHAVARGDRQWEDYLLLRRALR